MAVEETSESFNRLTETSDRLNEKINALAKMVDKNGVGFQSSFDSMTKMEAGLNIAGQAAMALGKSFTAGATAMYRGEKGMKAFEGSIDAATDAVGLLAAGLALLGGPISAVAAIVGGLAVAYGKYVKAANEQSDALYKAYQGISKAGAAGRDGMQGIYTDMQKLGLGVQDLDKMVEMINANSKDLSILGGSVRQGRNEFANIGKSMAQYREQMYNLGMSQDELNEGTMSYIRMQAKLGGMQNQTTQELADGARRYLIEQDALTKITGQSREEQEKARDEYLSQERFAATLYEMRKNGQVKEAEQLEKYVQTIGAHNKSAAKGIADMVSGNIQTKEARQQALVSNMEVMRNIDAIKSGQMNYLQAVDKDVDARREFTDTIGIMQAKVGNHAEIYGDLNGNLKLIAAQEKQRFVDRGNEARQEQADQMAGMDKETKAQTQLRLTQMRAMHSTQDFVRNGVEHATKATKLFADTLDSATSKLPGAGKAGNTQGASGGGGGGGGEKPGFWSRVGHALGFGTAGEKSFGVTGDTSGVDPVLLDKLNQASSQLGKTINITSGYRSQDKQQLMYNEWLKGGGGPNKPTVNTPTFGNVTTPAQPGYSQHEMGSAVDIDKSIAAELEKQGILKNLGLAWGGNFSRPDPVHIELAAYGEGGNLNGVGIVGEKGPELVVGQASVTSNNDIMEAFKALIIEVSSQSMLLAEIARATRSSSDANDKMLRLAQ